MAGAHMMMQCPRCSTRWRVPAATPIENPLFKCGRCHHLFRQFPGAPAADDAPRGGRRAAPPEPDTLEFIFPERQPATLECEPAAPEPARHAARRPTPERRAATVVVEPGAPAPAAPGDPRPAADEAPPWAAADDASTGMEAAPSLDAPAAVTAEPAPVHASWLDHLAVDPAPLAPETTVRLEAPSPPPAPPVIVPRADQPASAPRFDELALPFGTRDDDEDEVGRELLAEPAGADGHELGDLDDDDDQEDAEGEDVSPLHPAGIRHAGRTLRVEDVMKAPAGFGTIMRAIGMTVSGFAALAMVVRVAPEHARAWLSRLPLAGASFVQDRNLAAKVELRNVQGRFQRLRNARRVFVISGDVRNNSATTIERIEVAGALYDVAGGELDHKIVTTGNRTALTDLSEAEIVLLQRLDPAIALAPGETTPFLIVFLEPPRELREFSSRVLSVRPTRRASSPPADSRRGSVG